MDFCLFKAGGGEGQAGRGASGSVAVVGAVSHNGANGWVKGFKGLAVGVKGLLGLGRAPLVLVF